MPPKPNSIKVTQQKPRTKPKQLRNRGNNKKFRKEVLIRDDYTCVDCSNPYPEYELEADHIVPLHAGGTNDLSNGATRCKKCHLKKTLSERNNNE